MTRQQLPDMTNRTIRSLTPGSMFPGLLIALGPPACARRTVGLRRGARALRCWTSCSSYLISRSQAHARPDSVWLPGTGLAARRASSRKFSRTAHSR